MEILLNMDSSYLFYGCKIIDLAQKLTKELELSTFASTINNKFLSLIDINSEELSQEKINLEEVTKFLEISSEFFKNQKSNKKYFELYNQIFSFVNFLAKNFYSNDNCLNIAKDKYYLQCYYLADLASEEKTFSYINLDIEFKNEVIQFLNELRKDYGTNTHKLFFTIFQYSINFEVNEKDNSATENSSSFYLVNFWDENGNLLDESSSNIFLNSKLKFKIIDRKISTFYEFIAQEETKITQK